MGVSKNPDMSGLSRSDSVLDRLSAWGADISAVSLILLFSLNLADALLTHEVNLKWFLIWPILALFSVGFSLAIYHAHKFSKTKPVGSPNRDL